MHAHVRAAGFHAGAHAVALGTEAVSNRVLDAQGSKVQAGQRAVLGRYFNLEGFLGRKPDFPRHFAGGTVQVVFAAVFGVRQLHQHALRQAAVEVEQHGIAPHATHHDAASAGEHIVVAHAGNGTHFVGQIALNASGAG